MPNRSKDYRHALYKIMSQDVWDVLEVKHNGSCIPNKQKDVTREEGPQRVVRFEWMQVQQRGLKTVTLILP